MLDSAAAFETRIRELSLADYADNFKKLGYLTFADFAFSSSATPVSGDDRPFLAVAQKVLGSQDHPMLPRLRRLVFECHTLVAADMNHRVTATSDDPPKKMPLAERAARMKSLKERMVGLNLEGELEVSYDLVDRAYAYYEENQLRYLEWAKCTKRSQELRGARRTGGVRRKEGS